MEADSERQENELLALESIFDERQFKQSTAGSTTTGTTDTTGDTSIRGGEVSIFLELPRDFALQYSTTTVNAVTEASADGASSEIVRRQESVQHEVLIEHLPPLVLSFVLPPDYPSNSPPRFTLSCKWIGVVGLSVLCRELDRTWSEQDGEEVLFQWCQLLTGDTSRLLNIVSPFRLTVGNRRHLRMRSTSQGSGGTGGKKRLDDRAVQDSPGNITSLVESLIDYSRREKEHLFSATFHTCDVCFLEKRGSECVRFPRCEHVYCATCMEAYFTSQVSDGAVTSLTCPTDKCDSQADPGLVKHLVSADIYQKYETFLLQTTLECMSDVVFCPRKTCAMPTLQDETAEMAVCSQCQYAFCLKCKGTYHPCSPCPASTEEMKRLKMMYSTGDAETRRAIEEQYGRQKMENAMSELWVEGNAKHCPKCNTAIEKTDGCNKMTCHKCQTHFCWLCGARLPLEDPYKHFNSANSECNNKLFMGVAEEDFEIMFEEESDEDDEWGFIHGLMVE